MVVSPDNKTLIISESFAGRLTAFDIAADGSLSNRRVWAEGLGPDGITMDADGAVWTSTEGNACVRVREGGEILQRIELDGSPFALMLGGPDRRTLFIMAAAWNPAEPVRRRAHGEGADDAGRRAGRRLAVRSGSKTTDDRELREFGCVRCWPADAEAAWEARRALARSAELIEESHFHVMLLACPACDQRYVSVFTETIDWADGDDPQHWSLLPVTAAEAAELTSATRSTDRSGARSAGARSALPAAGSPKRRAAAHLLGYRRHRRAARLMRERGPKVNLFALHQFKEAIMMLVEVERDQR